MANDEKDDDKARTEDAANDEAADTGSSGDAASAGADDSSDAPESDATSAGDEAADTGSDPEHEVGVAPSHDHDHDHGHAHAAGGDDHGDELAHVTPVRLLVTIWAALSVLTILTVSVTHWDFGGQTNLVVAMVIATMKASLVVVFFMHLRWDRRFHALVFLSSLLFVILFIGLALTDRSEYQPSIDEYEAAKAALP